MSTNLRDPRKIPYQGIEMQDFNRIHLNRAEQPCWGDGKRVLKIIPPQRNCPDGCAYLFEPGCHNGLGEPFVYTDYFLPEDLKAAR